MTSQIIETFYMYFQGIVLFQVVFFATIYYVFRSKETLYYITLNLATATYFFLNAPATFFSISEDLVFNSVYYELFNYLLILLIQFSYLLFIKQIFKDSMTPGTVQKCYNATLILLPFLYILFCTLIVFNQKTDIIFFLGHCADIPFIIILLLNTREIRGYISLIKYGMTLFLVFTLCTAYFSLRFNAGFHQVIFDTYPLLFLRIGLLFDIILFQLALLQNWHHQEQALALEKIKSQLNSERIRSNISAELHDDLGATLSGVKLYGHLLKSQIESSNDKAQSSLNIILDSVSDMIEKLKEIVWDITPRVDSFKNTILKTEAYISQMCQPKNIDLTVTIDDIIFTNHISFEIQRNIYFICKEVVNNAVKYSSASQLIFEIKQIDAVMYISIKDNGKGFNLTVHTPGNGLTNLKKRAAEINADLVIETAPGQGCQVQLIIKK
jgi:signal transduction histidine kinase